MHGGMRTQYVVRLSGILGGESCRAGEIPEELKQKMFATVPVLEHLFEAVREDFLNQPGFLEPFCEASSQERSSMVAMFISGVGIIRLR